MKRPLVIAAVALVVAACGDSPAEPVPTPTAAASPLRRSVNAATASQMAAIGADLVDATETFLAVVDDAEARSAMSGAIKALADALVAGDSGAASTRLQAARDLVAAKSEDTVQELAPVSLALDNVEAVLTSSTPELH
jgi:hypothetical protein